MFVCWVQKEFARKKKDTNVWRQTNRYSDRTIRDHFGMGLAISMVSHGTKTQNRLT